jgi:hypothetical protein
MDNKVRDDHVRIGEGHALAINRNSETVQVALGQTCEGSGRPALISKLPSNSDSAEIICLSLPVDALAQIPAALFADVIVDIVMIHRYS